MIIVSDNSAANYLIDLLGIDKIEHWLNESGFDGCHISRRLFDDEASARGIQNYITAADIGRMLEMIFRGELVSRRASARMLEILSFSSLTVSCPSFSKALTTPLILHIKQGRMTALLMTVPSSSTRIDHLSYASQAKILMSQLLNALCRTLHLSCGSLDALLMIGLKEICKILKRFLQNLYSWKINDPKMIRLLPVEASSMNYQYFFLS